MIRGDGDDGDDDGEKHDKKLREPRHKCQGINSFLTDPDINLRRLNVFNLVSFYS